MKIDNKKRIQERKYEFPYHYIPRYKNGNFTQTRNLAWGYEYLSYMYFVLNELKKINFISLLDVGCGDGRFLFEAQKKFANARLVGIDIFKDAVNFANAFSNGPRYCVGNITNKDLFKEKFDVITLIETLEHIPPQDIPDFLDGLSYYLKDSGYFLLTVPSNNVSKRARHYQHFDFKSLEDTLDPYFHINNAYYLNKLSLQDKIIRSLLSNKFFVLNNQYILNKIYDYYSKHLVKAEKNNARRIFVVCKKRADQ